MTILQALDGFHARVAARGEAEPSGFSHEKISFAVLIEENGRVVDVVDLRLRDGGPPQPVLLSVPAARKRTVAILPNRFWDKTSYALGRTARAGHRAAEEHAAFRALHRTLLAGADDPGLVALARFIEHWNPAAFDAAPFGPEMLDTNVVFGLLGDEDALGRRRLIHERRAARILLARAAASEEEDAPCLVTGRHAPLRRLHPTVRGVVGAQTSGAALVSFNLDAFSSYGKEQGANAPVCEAAASHYGAALNRLLDRASPNRLPYTIGDTSVVFWADASQVAGLDEGARETAARAAEAAFARWLGAPRVDAAERWRATDTALAPSLRFHALGLAPNAARLAVRFWFEADFQSVAGALASHRADTRLEPLPVGWGEAPSLMRLLAESTAAGQAFEQVSHTLAGETMRAILAGTPYPRTLLAAAIARLRAGGDAGTGWHAAVIRAVLVRAGRVRGQAAPAETPEDLVALDRRRPHDPAYHLGRLFAVMETTRRRALGQARTTIRERCFATACAAPAGVFPLLIRRARGHVGMLREAREADWVSHEIDGILARLPPALPRSLGLDGQGRFAIGYYHQRRVRFGGGALDETEFADA